MTVPVGEPIAAIDLGTNTALLLVARRAEDGALETLEELCLAPRLGAGLARSGHLEPAAQDRALAALHDFGAVIARHGVAPSRVRAVGTACLRRALDGAEFARRATRATGIAVEVLSESDEARFGEMAIEIAGAGRDALVVDVGGGSTEVACRALGLCTSIPCGAVVLTELWLAPGADAARGWRGLRAAVEAQVRAFPQGAAHGRETWAIGGTAVHLGNLDAAGTRFDPRAVEGRVVPARRALEFAERLAPLARGERLAYPIDAERADILPAGLAALAATLARLGALDVRITGFGLRHGLALDLLRG